MLAKIYIAGSSEIYKFKCTMNWRKLDINSLFVCDPILFADVKQICSSEATRGRTQEQL